jgi:aminopeptidase N
MASNLTRNEAGDRARLIKVESYRIDLDLTRGETTFRSRTTIAFHAASPGASSFVDLTAPDIREITLNGRQVGHENFTGHRITLDGLAAANELTVVADCAYSRTGEGLHRFTDPADKGVYLYSDLETFDAHQIYACFDQPDLKARSEFTVTVPDTWLVVSNMAPDDRRPGFTRHPAVALPGHPADVHHITAIAPALPRGAGRPRRHPARHLLPRVARALPDPDEIFEVTRQGFDYFHESFGVRYPFGKYDQLFVPEFKRARWRTRAA